MLFNVVVFLISCAKKKAEEIRDANSSKPPIEATTKPTKFTPEMVKAAFEYAAQKLPEETRQYFLKESPLGGLYEATDGINSSIARGRIKVSEVSPTALGEMIYEQSKKRYRPGYRARANRIKCLKNLGNVYKAGLAFAQDNGERMPWQLTPAGVRNHIDRAAMASDQYGRQINPAINEVKAHSNSLAAAGVFGLNAMKRELVTPKILNSPYDPSRADANEKVQENWLLYDTKAKGVSAELGAGASYVLVRGADTQRPSSIYAVTRNWGADSLNTGKWLGFDSDPGNARTMAGLTASQGQIITMDGGLVNAANADFQGNGRLTKAANTATGGVAKGRTSLNLIRGPGL